MIRKNNKKKETERIENQKSGIVFEQVPEMDRKYYNACHLCLNAGLNATILISSIISIMSAFDIVYNKIVLILTVTLMCIMFSSFYLKVWWKLIGYIAILIGFIYGVTNYAYVIRGGFGIIANKFMEVLEVRLDLPIERRYDEYVNNKVYAVTLCLIFIACSLGLLLNIAINETKGFIIAFFSTFPFVQIGMYLGKRMDIMSSVLYFSALICLIILRNSRYYKIETKRHKGYSAKKKKNIVTYDYVTDPRNSFSITIIIIVVIMVCSGVIALIFPRAAFRMDEKYSAWKDSTLDTAKRIAIVGFWGMLNPNGSGVGGISRNELGNVDRITLGYEKQLGVTTMVIPEEEYIYLRAYTGTYYEDNRWKYISESENRKKHNLENYTLINRPWSPALNSKDVEDLTNEILKIDFEKGRNLTDAKKSIWVENVFANINYTYLPYNVSQLGLYCKLVNDDEYDASLFYESEFKCLYYHLKEENIVKTGNCALNNYLQNKEEEVFDVESAYRKYVYDTYLDVPEKNRTVIMNILQKHDIYSEDGLYAIDKIKNMFENEYEYTLMPGKTPSKKDFVNYFLMDSKKGYCTYFASSAVLMFRSLGIPARYVGGYMFDTTDNDTRREAYYRLDDLKADGVLSEGTPYIIDVTDADAHAWVEVYIDYLGWVRVEVTPGALEENGEDDSGVNQLLTDALFNRQTYERIKKSTIVIILLTVLLAMLTVVMYIFIAAILRYRRKRRYDPDKDFGYLLSVCRVYKLGWNSSMTYEELAELLCGEDLCSEKNTKRLAFLVEKSKYSRNELSDDEKKEIHVIVTGISVLIKKRISVFKIVRYLYLF